MDNGYLSSPSKEGDKEGIPRSEPLFSLVLVTTLGK